MAPDRRRHALLARLERVRSIERQSALTELGHARAEHQRLLSLAERSEGLARDYAARREAKGADELHRLFAVRSHLSQLAETAAQMGAQASQAAELASHQYLSANHRHELVGNRLQAERSAIRSRGEGTSHSSQDKLARGLHRRTAKTRSLTTESQS